jgi:hypothetical protein
MSGYIGTQPVPQATQTRQTFTATSGQTSFATIGYVAGGQFIQVYLNGVLLKLTDDYTAANGSDIVLTSGAATGDILEFITFADFTVNNQNFTGGLTVDNDGSTVLTVDRATSDGTIIDVQKSGSSVGIIGTKSSGLYIGSDDAGIFFNDHGGGDLDAIYPYDLGTDTFYNGHVNIGGPSNKFKNIYISGSLSTDDGITFGSTGGSVTSNTLDSYEEGSWTPALKGTFSNPTGTATSQNTGQYTKIGNMVMFRCNFAYNSISGGSGQLVLGDLPFTAVSSINWYTVSLGYRASAGSFIPAAAMLQGGTDKIRFWRHASTDARSNISLNLSLTEVSSAIDFYLAGTYHTSA